MVGEIPGTLYGLSGSGWMDSVLFEEWFTSHFLVHAPSIRPLLLLLDGHASHYNSETGCRGGHYTFLPAASHHTSPAAIRQWGIRIVEGPLEKRVPPFLHIKSWESRKSQKFHATLSEGLGAGDDHLQCNRLLSCCRRLPCS